MHPEAPPPEYIGRFAPSPTGPLHFGSLLAATASYLDARAHRGKWLLRIEDIDPPRAQPGATRAIIRTLEAYGFEWQGEIYYQSHRLEAHRSLVNSLVDAGRAYPCSCSRLDLAGSPRGPLGIIYPGYCRDGSRGPETAIRLRTDNQPIVFDDRLQGRQRVKLETTSGDFVVLRRDGLIAYQLAVVADDFDQGITDVVRGIDLLDSTPRQIHLQHAFEYATPRYAHIPVIQDAAGLKLGKSTHAPAVPVENVRPTLVATLATLAQQPPADLVSSDLESIWSWAIDHWTIEALAGRTAAAAPAGPMADRQNRLS